MFILTNTMYVMYVMYSSKVTFRAIKLGRYVTPGDGGNYVTFHELNVRIKIKKILTHNAKTETSKF